MVVEVVVVASFTLGGNAVEEDSPGEGAPGRVVGVDEDEAWAAPRPGRMAAIMPSRPR